MTTDSMFLTKTEGGLRLITPNHTAGAANAPWTKETILLRSRVETLYGHTVSQGFKKFFNLGQGPDGLRIDASDVIRACEKGDAIATLKLDGSLLIRSEFHGKVMFRTRGGFGYEHLNNAYEMFIFEDLYPKLFETKRCAHLSLLFEWTSPQNVIVLKYPEEKLTLIGGVDHFNHRYLTMKQLGEVASSFGVPLVEWFSLSSDQWGVVNTELNDRKDIEGYVVRINGEQDLIKVKCTSYLTRHALKSSLDSEKLADMYFQLGRPTFEGFCDYFRSAFDEETMMWAIGAISALYDGVTTYNRILEHMARTVEHRKGMSRKDAAIAGQAEYGQTKRFSAYMIMWQGKEIPTGLLKTILLQSTKQVELRMFRSTELDEPG